MVDATSSDRTILSLPPVVIAQPYYSFTSAVKAFEQAPTIQERKLLLQIQNISYAFYFRLFRTQWLPYENKMHTKKSKPVRESAAISGCMKISCVRKVEGPKDTKISCVRNILDLQ